MHHRNYRLALSEDLSESAQSAPIVFTPVATGEPTRFPWSVKTLPYSIAILARICVAATE
jgi:hypothetical protein